jgi:pSer/pThr/pTyr-binding forkhead associated (FHA) protein
VPVEDRGEPVGALRLGDGTEYPLYRGVNSLGRRSTNTIVLADAFASGRHAEITIDDSGAVLTDMGSTNGTFLAGQRLAANTPTPIADGTVIRFAKTDITYSAAGAPPSDVEATMMAPPVEEEPAPEAVE